MVRLLLKETILIGSVWMSGMVFLFLKEVPLTGAWTLYCLLMGVFFAGGSSLLNYWLNKGWGFPALVFVLFSLLNQILFLAILFIFLEPGEPNHRMIALLALAGYLISFIFDTRWKLQWIQTHTREKIKEN